jgi:hypothetical protein
MRLAMEMLITSHHLRINSATRMELLIVYLTILSQQCMEAKRGLMAEQRMLTVVLSLH